MTEEGSVNGGRVYLHRLRTGASRQHAPEGRIGEYSEGAGERQFNPLHCSYLVESD